MVVAMLAVAVGTLAASACGDDERGPGVAATLRSALDRFEERDRQGLCELLSADAKLVIGSAVHLQPTTCERDVGRFFKWLEPYGEQARRPVVTKVTTEGPDRARATVRLADGALVTAPFSREDGTWKLDGLLDATLSRIQARNTPREKGRLLAVSDVPRPAVAGTTSVEHGPGRGAFCPRVDDDRLPAVGGGCLVNLAGKRLTLSAVSPFGRMAFAECDIELDLRVGGDGRGWIATPTIDGRNPCFDAAPCFSKQERGMPWPARIDYRQGKMELAVDVCLDTCVGRFEGRWKLDFVKLGTGWRARSEQGMVGTSGWRFDGVLNTPARVDVTAQGDI